MSRIIVSVVVIIAIAAGAYYFLNKPEPTPAERFEAAVQDAGDALSEAAEAAADATTNAVEQATDKASEMAKQAEKSLNDAAELTSEQLAALQKQAEGLVKSWEEQGALTEEGFNYDKMVKAIEDSTLSDEAKGQLIQILAEIKASPETVAAKIEEFRKLMAQ